MSSSDHRRPPETVDDFASNRPLTPVLERLTDRRRRILDALLEEGPLPEGELAARLAAEGSSRDPDAEAIERARVELRGVHLPALADAGLLERREGTVDASDHPIYEEPQFRALLAAAADLDGLVDCLADERRRRVLAVLEARDGPVTEESLAREATDGSSTVEEVRIELHHVHLPKLEANGLVERDETGALVAADPEQAEYVEFLVGA